MYYSRNLQYICKICSRLFGMISYSILCYSVLCSLQLCSGRTDPRWTLLLQSLLHPPPSPPPVAILLTPSSPPRRSLLLPSPGWTSCSTWSSSSSLSTPLWSWSPAPATSSCSFSSGTTRKDTTPPTSSSATWHWSTWSCASSASLWLHPTHLTNVDGCLDPTCVTLSLSCSLQLSTQRSCPSWPSQWIVMLLWLIPSGKERAASSAAAWWSWSGCPLWLYPHPQRCTLSTWTCGLQACRWPCVRSSGMAKSEAASFTPVSSSSSLILSHWLLSPFPTVLYPINWSRGPRRAWWRVQNWDLHGPPGAGGGGRPSSCCWCLSSVSPSPGSPYRYRWTERKKNE